MFIVLEDLFESESTEKEEILFLVICKHRKVGLVDDLCENIEC